MRVRLSCDCTIRRDTCKVFKERPAPGLGKHSHCSVSTASGIVAAQPQEARERRGLKQGFVVNVQPFQWTKGDVAQLTQSKGYMWLWGGNWVTPLSANIGSPTSFPFVIWLLSVLSVESVWIDWSTQVCGTLANFHCQLINSALLYGELVRGLCMLRGGVTRLC